MSACEEMQREHIRSPHLLALLVDVYEEEGGEEKRREAVKVRKEKEWNRCHGRE